MALYGAPVSHPPLPQRNPLLGRPEGFGPGPAPSLYPAGAPAMHDRGQPGMDNVNHPPNLSFGHYGGESVNPPMGMGGVIAPNPQEQLQALVARLRGQNGLQGQPEGLPGRERKILLGGLPLQGEGMGPGRDGQRLLGRLPVTGERHPLSDLLMALGG